jgi:hypothetical protein
MPVLAGAGVGTLIALSPRQPFALVAWRDSPCGSCICQKQSYPFSGRRRALRSTHLRNCASSSPEASRTRLCSSLRKAAATSRGSRCRCSTVYRRSRSCRAPRSNPCPHRWRAGRSRASSLSISSLASASCPRSRASRAACKHAGRQRSPPVRTPRASPRSPVACRRRHTPSRQPATAWTCGRPTRSYAHTSTR